MKYIQRYIISFIFSIVICVVFANSLEGADQNIVTMQYFFSPDTLELDNTVVRDGDVIVSEVPLATEAVDVDPTRVFVSSHTNSAIHAFDGNPLTMWKPEHEEIAYIGVDFGGEKTVSAVEWDGYTYGEAFPAEYEFLISSGGDNEFYRIRNLTVTGPSGRKLFPDGVVTDNIDSHNVRINFPPVNAEKIMFRIYKSTPLGIAARIARLDVFGMPTGKSGTIIATFKPYKVNRWLHKKIDGIGIETVEYRFKNSGNGGFSDWVCFADNVLFDVLNREKAIELQVRVKLVNPTNATSAKLSALSIEIDGIVAGPPQGLIPLNGSEIANCTPSFMWQPGANTDMIESPVYEIQISQHKSFMKSDVKTFFVEGDDTCRLLVEDILQERGVYYWRIRCAAEQEGVADKWSEVYSFKLIAPPNPPWNNSSFGMNMGLDSRPWGSTLAKDAGFKWARQDISWYHVQPVRERWNWDDIDSKIAVARENNISVDGVLGYTPAYMASNLPLGKIYRGPPQDIRDWVKYVNQCVTRYKNDIAVWEIWNEQNHRSFFKALPRQYAPLLKTAYIVIKNVSPNAKVTFGGHAGFSPHYLDEVVRFIGYEYWDILNWHVYPGMPDEPYYQSWINRVMSYQRERGLCRPVWLTEMGYAREANRSEDEIAAVIVANMVANLQVWPGEKPNRIDKTFLFQLIEGHGFGKPQKWAMVVDYNNPDRMPKQLPVFKAYKNTVRVLSNAEWRKRSCSAGLVIYHFSSNDKNMPYIYVVWSEINKKKSCARIISKGNIKLTDMYGRVLYNGSSESMELYEFSRKPVFVFGELACDFK